MDPLFDVAIIGGGINGCGCAADAALRGLSVFLCEQDDLASKTSSSSTKLIHGGLRYLEHFDFTLVKNALDERQILMEAAPHLVHPLALFLPYNKHMRPVWMLRMGLFLYDHLSRKNKLPKTHYIRKTKQPNYFSPLSDEFSKGFLYYDCETDDARLTITNALQAKEHGASIQTRTKLINAKIRQNQWVLTLKPEKEEAYEIRAKSVINAAGPWVKSVSKLLSLPLKHEMSLVKGSHLVVPKLYEEKHAYLLQHRDERVVFVIPYYNRTMIGTTDIAFNDSMDSVAIEKKEIIYLLELVNQYFKKKIQEKDILFSWSGVRPLLAEPGKTAKALSRDYACGFISQPAPAVTIYGGKITTYRQLAVKAVNQLKPVFNNLPLSNTKNESLPGAAWGLKNFSDYTLFALEKYNWLSTDILKRFLKSYGTRTELILTNCHNISDLGIRFSDELYQAEVDYLVAEEWAQTVEDVLWRRTRLGLTTNKANQAALEEYLKKIFHYKR